MVVVGELILSAFLTVLFEKLASGELLSFVRGLGEGVDSDLKKWERKLKMIEAVLRDAEEKQLMDGAVKLWLDDLQDLAYDAEDILDEFATDALKNKLMADNQEVTTITGKGQSLMSSCFSCFNPLTIKFNSDMRTKVRDITSRLEDLLQQMNILQLTPGGASSIIRQQRPPSSSLTTEGEVFGRKQDKAKILEMVLTDNSNEANFVVIPIVGMGGIGKTTLAREVYNDKAVEDSKFDVKAWVCVSDNFDVLGISKALLESITGNSCHLSTLNQVQVELKKVVDGKRFLLVLDDVWNDNYRKWLELKAPFSDAATHSKMIVTTRHSHVASIMGPIDHYNVKHLSDDDSWLIFIKHACHGREFNPNQISQSSRQKVVGRCGGLPLAAITLGGLLRTCSYNSWEGILDSKIWDLPQENDILSVLRLSYHHLPSHLKSCFSYCAIFPKDYEFSEKELVDLWVASGFVQQSRNSEQLKIWGSKCFGALVSRSLFLQSSTDSATFVMHDLIHDLAQSVSGDTIFRLEESNTQPKRFEKVRHSSYVREPCDGKTKFGAFFNIKNTRTFLPVCIRHGNGSGYITSMVLYDLLPKFKKLRVLSLQGYDIHELLISFENLRLLRYLNLADTKIRSLPESTSSLFNLEILILKNCFRLIKLPTNMRNLINLQQLDIRGTTSLKEMPIGMKNLKSLQTLSNFIVGKGETVSGLEDLKFLKSLKGKLHISGLENVNDSQNAREAALYEKNDLELLSLKWNEQSEVVEECALEVLDMLQPHHGTKKLTIKNYNGAKFPLWLKDPMFSKMEILKLENIRNCISLPSLGSLSSLKHLSLKGFKKLKSISYEVYGECFLKSFQSLEILSFNDMREWELWDADIKGSEYVENFPLLREISIVECPKLSGKLPELLPSLETLVVSKCGKLVVSFSGYPMLSKLKVEKCQGLMCSASLESKLESRLVKSLTISSCALNIEGQKGMLYNSVIDSSLAKILIISNVLEFGKIFKDGLKRINTLAIGNSESRNTWHPFNEETKQGLNMIANPEEVSIEGSCTSLVSFPKLCLSFYNLHSLSIENIASLKCLPDEMMGSNSLLESLFIKDCNSLTFIGRPKLPSSLKKLFIENCKSLQHLVDGQEDAFSSSSSAALKRLSIRSCPELRTLSSTIQLQGALEFFRIEDCQKMESLPDGLQNLNCLKNIYIRRCPSIVSFPKGGLPNTISEFGINSCQKLEALPDDMHKLNSLQYLEIGDCPSIVSFPKGGIPTNLTRLVIGDVKMYKALINWGLQRLTSLTYLRIEGCHETEFFPDKQIGMMLPTSLTILSLVYLPNLKYLSSIGLTSLQRLWINNCPKIAFFPELGFPSSLVDIFILDCPMLKQACERNKGKEWSKIAHIPCVRINWKSIYDPDSME